MGLVGPYLLDYLGITLPAFGIAGGILLFLIAIDMLFARPTGARATSEEERVAREGENPAVFPLAIPDDRRSRNDRDRAAARQSRARQSGARCCSYY